MKKKVLLSILMCVVLMAVSLAFTAVSVNANLRDEERRIQQEMNQTQTHLDGVRSNLNETTRQIGELSNRIAGYEQHIHGLDHEIATLERQIGEVEAQLVEAEREFSSQEEMLQNRLVALYMAGETTYLDVLLSSNGLVDFISNFFLISEIATFDTALLDQMDNNRNEIAETRAVLDEGRTQLAAVRQTAEQTRAQLRDAQSTLQDHAAELTEEERAIAADLEAQRADQAYIRNQIAAAEAAQRAREEEERRQQEQNRPGAGNSGNNNNNNSNAPSPSNPSASGFIWPVQSRFWINTGFPFGARIGNSTHLGVDFIGPSMYGTPIFAVADGTVVISTALRNPNGTFRSYGEYIVINHGNGIMTLYAHGSAGSRRVSVGDRVTQGQTIMNVGSTGNSTGPHLHFEVRVNGTPVNPVPYLR